MDPYVMASVNTAWANKAQRQLNSRHTLAYRNGTKFEPNTKILTQSAQNIKREQSAHQETLTLLQWFTCCKCSYFCISLIQLQNYETNNLYYNLNEYFVTNCCNCNAYNKVRTQLNSWTQSGRLRKLFNETKECRVQWLMGRIVL